MTRSALSHPEAAAASDSALAPLRRGGFRAVWSALAGSQLVIWMNTVGAVTVIAAVSDSSTLIALVQTANSLPAVLLALLTGTVADIVDRRRFALGAQLLMLAAVASLAALTLTDTVTAAAALGLTLALGAGMATTFVIYQALTPDFVSRGELPAAVALNGVAINLARAVGPALAGPLLPRLRRRVALDRLIVGASLGVGAGLLALAYVPTAALLAPAVYLTGACWLTVLSSLNIAAQRVAPGWVRARTLATFQLVMQGGLALGSLGLGIVTSAAGVRVALLIAAGGLAVGVLGVRRWPLGHSERADLSPAGTWSDPTAAAQLEPVPNDGPVLVTVEYRIDSSDADEFVKAMQELGRVRRRDGAYHWNLYEDLERPGCYLETFVVDSWDEHVRQHARLTVADLDVERRAKSMHRGPEPPAVRHLLWAPAALRAEGRPTG
jgi:MFS family permease